jgi:hypothetical protein
MWEWRGGAQKTAGTGGSDAIFFIGSLNPITIRMRYQAALIQFTGTVDFSNTYIPIMDCEEAVAYKFAYMCARTLTGITPAIADLKQSAIDAMMALKLEQTRRAQTVEYHRQGYGDGTRAGSQVGIVNLL